MELRIGIIIICLVLCAQKAKSQFTLNPAKIKIYSRSYGVIIGAQAGRNTFIELGAEQHWRKIKLFKPRLLAITANMEYDIRNNIIGYKAGIWAKRGRINFTFGANLCYYSDFEQGSFGITPSIGFRLFGFHLVNGYNLMITNRDFKKANLIYLSLRYYIPITSKIIFRRKK